MITKNGSKTKSINLTPALIAQIEQRAGRATFSSQVIADLSCHYSLLDVLGREMSGKFSDAEMKLIGQAVAGINLAGQVHMIQKGMIWNLDMPTILIQAKKQCINIDDLVHKIKALSVAECVALLDLAQQKK